MSNLGVLVFFSVVAAYVCAKARVAGGAVGFSLVAALLVLSTPVGAGVPGALSTFVSAVDRASAPVLSGSGGQR